LSISCKVKMWTIVVVNSTARLRTRFKIRPAKKGDFLFEFLLSLPEVTEIIAGS
jgi:hypothetical protein